MMKQVTKENLIIAFNSIKTQKLRTGITISIIALGLMALVGILTSIDALKSSLISQFERMGSNTIQIQKKASDRRRKNGVKEKEYPAITYAQANQFLKTDNIEGTIALNMICSGQSIVKYRKEESDPNCQVIAGTEKYLGISGYDLEMGRNFTKEEVNRGSLTCIIGAELASSLFIGESPIGKSMKIDNVNYIVVGILEEKGASMGGNPDRIVFIPLQTGRLHYGSNRTNYNIIVQANNNIHLNTLSEQAEGAFRIIRKDKLGKASSFVISRSDSLAKSLFENLEDITTFAAVIGLITLFGASIGLMNIMLVSVTERTKEIGTRMALGASPTLIRRQFLTEAVLICMLGGLLGVLSGVGIGNLVGLVLGSPFLFPIDWTLLGLALCIAVGIAAGIYPANKASNLDPIEALRYE